VTDRMCGNIALACDAPCKSGGSATALSVTVRCRIRSGDGINMPSGIPGLLLNIAHSDKNPSSPSFAFGRQSRAIEMSTAQAFASFLMFFTSAMQGGHWPSEAPSIRSAGRVHSSGIAPMDPPRISCRHQISWRKPCRSSKPSQPMPLLGEQRRPASWCRRRPVGSRRPDISSSRYLEPGRTTPPLRRRSCPVPPRMKAPRMRE
jgi:hypothetical protein